MSGPDDLSETSLRSVHIGKINYSIRRGSNFKTCLYNSLKQLKRESYLLYILLLKKQVLSVEKHGSPYTGLIKANSWNKQRNRPQIRPGSVQRVYKLNIQRSKKQWLFNL